LDLARSDDAAEDTRSRDLEPLARWRRRGGVARVRYPEQDFCCGGFELPEAKSGAEWLDRDTLLLASALGEGMATTSGYARTIRLWRRGTDVKAAPVLFETMPESMSVGPALTSRRKGNGLVHR